MECVIGSVLKPIAKIVLGLTIAASAADANIHKKMFGSGNTPLMILNEEMIHLKNLAY